MADPTQFQQLSEKLDDIKDIVSKLELKLEERGGLLRDMVHTETSAVRKEFNEFKNAIGEKLTATTVKLGFVFTIIMAIITAAVVRAMQQ
jgi:hypothetical protein